MRLWHALYNGLPQLQEILGVTLASPASLAAVDSRIAFSRSWQVLGPFAIGTREAPWGADPLEHHGGFGDLSYDPDARFSGSLVPGASLAWTIFNAELQRSDFASSRLDLDVSFEMIDWTFQQKIYGWSALQYQAWARGYLDIDGDHSRNVVLYTDGILEFLVDGLSHFGGDFYARRAAPIILHLSPGRHRIDLRLIRDVRAMGGTGIPNVATRLEAHIAKEPLMINENSVTIASVIDGQLASDLGSMTIVNSGTTALKVIRVVPSVREVHVDVPQLPFLLSSGQTRPLSFTISLLQPDLRNVKFTLIYTTAEHTAFEFAADVIHTFWHTQSLSPHKFTFRHPGGHVSYAIVRPPQRAAICPASMNRAPVMLALHGAGVEADSDMAVHSFDNVNKTCAWLLIPTGSTSWSSDDWHTWGFTDVEAAISNIKVWIEHNHWKGIGVDTDRWLVTGHSNGGQGVWYTLLHRPDNVFAAAIVSGYSSIQNYVPYQFWHSADPRQATVVHSALNSFRHEMLATNAKGIEIFQQHGSRDDNVPVYHARMMNQILNEEGVNRTYSELPEGHWFDGVMGTRALQEFYQSSLSVEFNRGNQKPDNFTITVANPGDTGSKNGVKITSLVDPGQYGRVEVQVLSDRGQVHLLTSNVHSLELSERFIPFDEVRIDFQKPLKLTHRFVQHGCTWKSMEHHDKPLARSNRSLRQTGNIDAIIRTNGIFRIFHTTAQDYHVALQVSRNFMQYYNADSRILRHGQAPVNLQTSNSISIFTSDDVPKGASANFPIQIQGGIVSIRDDTNITRHYLPDNEVNAVIYIRPLHAERLELVVWGRTTQDTAQAARLVPTLTGVGQPDFVVLSRSSKWKGVGGVRAMGFFDHAWNVSRSSFFS